MFHFGGLTDRRIKGLNEDEITRYISRELFYTCVEMQRVVALFNQASDKFMYEEADQSIKRMISRALSTLSIRCAPIWSSQRRSMLYFKSVSA